MNSITPVSITGHATMHPPIRLSARHRRVVYASFSILWLSGVLWLLFHYFLQRTGTFGNEPHALEPWWLRLHGLAMMVMLITAGSLVVPMDQPLARLAFMLLDPRSDDGLMAWNILDPVLGTTPPPAFYPVLRTMEAVAR